MTERWTNENRPSRSRTSSEPAPISKAACVRRHVQGPQVLERSLYLLGQLAQIHAPLAGLPHPQRQPRDGGPQVVLLERLQPAGGLAAADFAVQPPVQDDLVQVGGRNLAGRIAGFEQPLVVQFGDETEQPGVG